MASSKDDRTPTEAARRQIPFTFYAAANGRIYVRNVDQKVIDLGELSRESGGTGYLLDGNHMRGSGFKDDEAALRDIAAKVRFLWLDGQFTAVADARDDPGLNLDGATQIDVTLDELKPGERMEDATV
jgi:hypothetical protein